MNINALIIGCGNIGSNYDLENQHILTHSKAMFFSSWIKNVDVYDLNYFNSKKISDKYNFNVLKDYNENCLINYDIVSICTPTNTHYKYLKDCILKNVKLVICEKPISFSAHELTELLLLYNKGTTRILINYFRTLQNSYYAIKKKIDSMQIKLKKVKINYYKGILNYASHAFDLINFLFDQELKIKKFENESKVFDFFDEDPTIKGKFISNGVQFYLNGSSTKNPIFELELFFDNHTISILNHGDEVLFYERNKLILNEKNLTQNYMLDVINYAYKIYEDQFHDNFIKSMKLNKELLRIL